MAEILFDELEPVINYFPIKVGKAEMQRFENGYFKLTYDGLQWCVLNYRNKYKFREVKEFFLELNLAEGRVVTTGLGFGLIQSILSKRENIKEIIVYEKYTDIIRMFQIFAKESNFYTNKIKFINEDASNCVNEECDWLLMDHFECVHQPYWEVIDAVREINYNCKANNVLFWPMHQIYMNFCTFKALQFDNDSYSKFRELIKIDKLPTRLDDRLFEKLDYFKNYK